MAHHKICKNCGNWNHPDSGQCGWCGSRLPRPQDWFSTLGLVLIGLIVIGLLVYSVWSRSPAGARFRLPRATQAVPGE